MPIYDISCHSCGWAGEVLASQTDTPLLCPSCGGSETEKLLSAPSSLSGRSGKNLPGPGDHGCCGSSPAQASCAGPGSCCGKAMT